MSGDDYLKLLLFFVGTAISVMSLHIGLVRLIVSVNKEKAEDEKPGVFIVIMFGLIVIFCSPLPLMLDLFLSLFVPLSIPVDQVEVNKPWSATLLFGPSAFLTSCITFALALTDSLRFGKNHPSPRTWGEYYYLTAVWCVFFFTALLAMLSFFVAEHRAMQCFFTALSIPLLVIIVQFFRTTIRFVEYPSATFWN